MKRRIGLVLAVLAGLMGGYALTGTVPAAAEAETTYWLCFCKYDIHWDTLMDVDGCPAWDPHIPSTATLAQEICYE